MSRLKNFIKTNTIKWGGLILLISLVFILDKRYFTSPPLRSDDWNWIIYPNIFEPLQIINFVDRRPFFAWLLTVLSSILGLNIQWYYVVNWLLLFFSGLVFYLIIKYAFPEQAWLALPSALIYMIYPVNYARTWLIIINNTYALLLALCAILLMVLYAQSGNTVRLILGNALFLISLGTYEAGFGLVMLSAFLLIVFKHHLEKRTRILLASFLLTGIGFLLWRAFIQPHFTTLQDDYLLSLNLTSSTIIDRYIQGAFIFLNNWLGPLLFWTGEFRFWIFVGIGVLLIFTILVMLPGWIKSAKANSEFLYKDRKLQAKSLAAIFAVGVFCWAAGYIPVIFLWQPIFFGDGSRVNFSSIPGAAIALAAGIAGLITFFVHRKEQVKRILHIAIIPLLLLGLAYQLHSQNQRVQIWETKKAFWQSMFEVVPGLEDGTKVIIVIPGYDELGPFEMLPFRGDWEAESALRVLYHNQSLFSEYYYPDAPDYGDNWVPTVADLSRYLFVFYDPVQVSVRIIEDPERALALPVSTSGYDPAQRLTAYQTEMGSYRFLVD